MGGDTAQGPGFTVLERGDSKKSKSVDYESQRAPQLREERGQTWRRKSGQNPRHLKGGAGNRELPTIGPETPGRQG